MKTLKIFSFFFVWLNMGSINRGTHNFVADAQRSRASLSGGQAPRSTKEGRAKKRGKNCELLCMSIFFQLIALTMLFYRFSDDGFRLFI
jgi:hypothetical protein